MLLRRSGHISLLLFVLFAMRKALGYIIISSSSIQISQLAGEWLVCMQNYPEGGIFLYLSQFFVNH